MESRSQQARRIKAENDLDVSVECIQSRLQRGWSEARIVRTPQPLASVPVAPDHPYKTNSYLRVASRKIFQMYQQRGPSHD